MFTFSKKEEKKEGSILDTIAKYKPMLEGILGIKVDDMITNFALKMSSQQTDMDGRLGLLLIPHGGAIMANTYLIRDTSMQLLSSSSIERIEDLSKVIESFQTIDFSQYKIQAHQDGYIATESATTDTTTTDTTTDTTE